MEYDTRTYFTESEADDVKGFTIIDTNDGEYHIAEKWSRTDGEDKWLQYWIPADKLGERVAAGKCEKAATLTQEQYEAVCRKVDHSGVEPEPVPA